MAIRAQTSHPFELNTIQQYGARMHTEGREENWITGISRVVLVSTKLSHTHFFCHINSRHTAFFYPSKTWLHGFRVEAHRRRIKLKRNCFIYGAMKKTSNTRANTQERFNEPAVEIWIHIHNSFPPIDFKIGFFSNANTNANNTRLFMQEKKLEP